MKTSVKVTIVTAVFVASQFIDAQSFQTRVMAVSVNQAVTGTTGKLLDLSKEKYTVVGDNFAGTVAIKHGNDTYLVAKDEMSHRVSARAGDCPDPGRAPAATMPSTPRSPVGAAAVVAPTTPTSPTTPSLSSSSSSSSASSDSTRRALLSLDDVTDRIVPSAAGQELVQQAMEVARKTRNAATDDAATIAEAYRKVPVEKLPEYFERSRNELAKMAQNLESATGGQLLPAERVRFRNAFLNAADKAGAAADAVREELGASRRIGSTQEELPAGATPNPAAKTKSLAELFGQTLPTSDASSQKPGSNAPISAVSPDAQVNRLALFYGLPEAERQALLSKLKLAERPSLALKGGKKVHVPILHNGYILGAGRTAMDCSSFVSSILDVDARKTRFTTLDFRSMWIYRTRGILPRPPRYVPPRDEIVRKAAQGFEAIDLYEEPNLLPGDLLVFSAPNEPIGHVFIVKNYRASTMMAEVIEAAQSAGTIREREFSLTLYPPEAPIRFVRPGLFVLRLKADDNRACTYPGRRTASASNDRVPPGGPGWKESL